MGKGSLICQCSSYELDSQQPFPIQYSQESPDSRLKAEKSAVGSQPSLMQAVAPVHSLPFGGHPQHGSTFMNDNNTLNEMMQQQQQYSQGGTVDPQLQQLIALLNTKAAAPKQTAVVECPKSMVGRVIGKGGETIKALQQYTGAMIQIDQSTDPTRVTIAGSPQALQLAVSMVNDIVKGTFKGFAMLRQIATGTAVVPQPPIIQPTPVGGGVQPVYIQGYGFVPPSQVHTEDPLAASGLMRTSPSPTGPLTPPMTPLRAQQQPVDTMGSGLTTETLAALLSNQSRAAMGQEALLAQLLGQLNMNQQQQQQQQDMAGLFSHPLPHKHQSYMFGNNGTSSLLGSGSLSPPMGAVNSPAASVENIPITSSSLNTGYGQFLQQQDMYLSSSPGRASPLNAATNFSVGRKTGVETESPLGRYGAIGTACSAGSAGSPRAQSDDAIQFPQLNGGWE